MQPPKRMAVLNKRQAGCREKAPALVLPGLRISST